MDVSSVSGEHLLLCGKVGTVGCDNAFRVEHYDILNLRAQSHIKLCTAYGGSTCTIHNDVHICNVLASNFKSILQSCSRYDGSTMLVVVHNRNVESLLQTFFNIEAFWCLDVLKVDTTKSRSDLLYSLTELLWVFLVDLYVKHIDASVNLKQKSLAFHYWLATHGTNVAKAKYCSTI